MSDGQKQEDKNTVRHSVILLALLLLLATFTRFWHLGAESFWYDEYIMLDVTATFADASESIQAGRPPLIVILGALWTQVFGASEVGVRSLSAVLGVLSMGILYAISKQLFNENIALIATALATLSGYLIYYAQDYRYYSLLVLITLLSYYFFLQFLRTKQYRYVVPYVIFSALAYYTHLFGIFMLFAQAVFFLLYARKYRSLWLSWFVSQILIVLLTLPHFFFVFVAEFMDGGDSPQVDWIATLPNNTPFIATVKYIIYDDNYLRLTPFLIATIFFICAMAYHLFRHRKQYRECVRQDSQRIKSIFTDKLNPLMFVLTWFFLIMFTPYLLEPFVGALFLHRYVIGAAPAFFILLALGLWSIRHSIPIFASVGALVIFMGLGLVAYYQEPTREEWGRVFSVIAEHETPNDRIVYHLGNYNPNVNMRFDSARTIYYEGMLDACPYYEDRLTDTSFVAELNACLADSDTLWVVMREYQSGARRIANFSAYLNTIYDAELINQRVFFGLQLLEYRLDSENER